MNFIPTFYPKVKYLIIFARLLSIPQSDPHTNNLDALALPLEFVSLTLLFEYVIIEDKITKPR